jgi:hypothetical protein
VPRRPALPVAPRFTTAEAAIAASVEARTRADAERPMALIPTGALLMDRTTLEGGGPQWWVRAFQPARDGARAGVWSKWEIDCGWRQVDRLETIPVGDDGALGAVQPDTEDKRDAGPDDDAYALMVAACDPAVWDRPAMASPADAAETPGSLTKAARAAS